MSYTQRRATTGQVPASPSAARAASISRANQMRDAYSNGVRAKGFTVTISAATSSFNVDLSGMARNFLGFAWYFTTVPGGAIVNQLVINNDVVVDSSVIQHFIVNGANHDRDYFPFPRPLNGQDSIVFNFVNPGAVATGYLVVYYI